MRAGRWRGSGRSGVQTARYRQLLEFNRSLVLIVDPEALRASVAGRMTELFGAERVAILQLVPERGRFAPTFGSGYEPGKLAELTLHRRGRLAKWLSINEKCFVVERSGPWEYLAEEERLLLSRLGVGVCAPLVSLNRLTGIIFLGSPRPGWRLEPEDLELLELLAGQAALAFENAQLYREQRDRLQRLDRAERLAAAGQVAAGVAHEVRNPLTTIRSTVQHLLRQLETDGLEAELLAEVVSEVDRIDRIVDGLVSLTRKRDFHPERLDLGEALAGAVKLVEAGARSSNVEIVRRLGPRRVFVSGDPGELRQLFLNLLLNAMQAMQRGGILTLAIVPWQPDFASHSRHWTEVRITDSGPGIEAEHLDRVFDPFFTTKENGTGLGLAICHSIVERHNGEIGLRHEPEGGTTAFVRLLTAES